MVECSFLDDDTSTEPGSINTDSHSLEGGSDDIVDDIFRAILLSVF